MNDEILDKAQARAYLVIAKRCVENARMHVSSFSEDMRNRLNDMYYVLNDMTDTLHDELFKEE